VALPAAPESDDSFGFAYRVARRRCVRKAVSRHAQVGCLIGKGDHRAEILQTLQQIIALLLTLLVELIQYALVWSLLIVWIAWWLWGVNWKENLAGPGPGRLGAAAAARGGRRHGLVAAGAEQLHLPRFRERSQLPGGNSAASACWWP